LKKKLIFAFTILILLATIPSIFNICNILEAKLITECKEIFHLERNEFQLHFNSSDFNKLKWFDENEFEFKGKLYDVISIQKKAANYIIVCECDVKETKYLHQFISEINSSSKKNTGKILIKINAENLFIPEDIVCLIPAFSFKSGSIWFARDFFIQATYLSSLAPPPKLI
jgi:hypothetical protein